MRYWVPGDLDAAVRRYYEDEELRILHPLPGSRGAVTLGVYVDELKTVKKVEFVNYTGPLSIFQTDFDIRSIGRGRSARGRPSPASRVGVVKKPL